jgi:NAD(P)-dependent dehydrogenase (short-subunit alcohol dehydrogenase family)
MDNLPKWISGIVEKYGKIKGMVLSHGVQETLPLSAINIEKAKKLFDTNYFSLIGLIKGFCKKNNYTEIGNSIVCLSSFVTQIGLPATVNYSASKGALNSAVKVLGVELARNGIRINSILSGHIETELLSKEDNLKTDDFLEKLRQKYPLGLGKPEDIANLASFLLSDASRWITGANIVIDGGGSLVF